MHILLIKLKKKNILDPSACFHQNDKRFKDNTTSNQCKCNAFVYLAMNFGINKQALVDLDSYLNIGEHVYRTTVRQWKRDGKYRSIFLSFDEIPNVIETDKGKFKIIKKDTLFVLLLRSVRLLTSLHFMQFSLIIIKKDTFLFVLLLRSVRLLTSLHVMQLSLIVWKHEYSILIMIWCNMLTCSSSCRCYISLILIPIQIQHYQAQLVHLFSSDLIVHLYSWYSFPYLYSIYTLYVYKLTSTMSGTSGSRLSRLQVLDCPAWRR